MPSFSSLLDRSWKYTIGILGLQSDDIILTSFPKSGNTWVRFFFCNLISLKEWDGETVTFPKLDGTMPELGVSNLLQEWSHETIPRIVKTHKSFWPFFDGKRGILLIRDPRDVMVSYYHFERDKVRGNYEGDFSSFIRHPKYGLEAWCKHYQSWQEEATVLLRYEDLKEDDVHEFSCMLDALSIHLSQDLIREAARQSRFEKVRKVEEKHDVRASGDYFKKGKRFTRKGKTGEWEDYFDDNDLQYFDQIMDTHSISIYRNRG